VVDKPVNHYVNDRWIPDDIPYHEHAARGRAERLLREDWYHATRARVDLLRSLASLCWRTYEDFEKPQLKELEEGYRAIGGLMFASPYEKIKESERRLGELEPRNLYRLPSPTVADGRIMLTNWLYQNKKAAKMIGGFALAASRTPCRFADSEVRLSLEERREGQLMFTRNLKQVSKSEAYRFIKNLVNPKKPILGVTE
jgi:hypothetical protein